MANIEFKCPCCGGALNFDSNSQNIVCPYCDSSFSASDLEEYTKDLEEDGKEDISWDDSNVEAFTNEEMKGMKIYSCNSCGGEIICEATTSSTVCPYCGNNLVVSHELAGDLRPNVIIPFKKNKDDVMNSLKLHFKNRLLLPSSFKKDNTIGEVKPLYVPYWLFDADVDGKVRYSGERTRRWSDSEYNYKEVKYYSIVRGGHIAFENVAVDGSKKMDDELMESIEPFNFSEATDFNAAFLAGYAADRYDVSKDETFNRATTRFREGTISEFQKDIHGFENVRPVDSNLSLSNTKTKYALYPVWLLNVLWNNNKYTFAVNGQTAKIAGNLPVSKLKATLFTLLTFIVFSGAIGALVWLITNQVSSMILFGLIIGALITALIVTIFYRRYKNVRFQYGATPYIKDGSLNINNRKEIYLYRRVTKTRRVNSDSNNRK